jgi:hypothetical protein
MVDSMPRLNFCGGQPQQNLVAARKRKEEVERAIEQAAQSWVLKARLFILQFKFADFGV